MVSLVDSRNGVSHGGDTESMILGLMRSDNKMIERSAILLKPCTPVTSQLEHAIAEANNPHRKTFTSAAAAINWLNPILDHAEIQRAMATFSRY